MKPELLRYWLITQPRPAKLLVHTSSGPKEVNCDPNKTWAQHARTVCAFDPNTIEALDADDNIIRATDGSDLDDDETEAPNEPVQAAIVGVVSEETKRFELVAKLLADAYRWGNENAFARMCDLFEAVNRRSETLERSLAFVEKLLRRTWEEKVEAAVEKEPNLLEGLLGAFAGGIAQAQATPPAPPTNGKGTVPQ